MQPDGGGHRANAVAGLWTSRVVAMAMVIHRPKRNFEIRGMVTA